MPPETTGQRWWTRKVWVVVVLPCVGAVLLAGVSIFKGWLHQRVGFDAEGNPIAGQPVNTGKPRTMVTAVDAYGHIVADLQRRDQEIRPRLRYLSLMHRHNEPSCSEADLEADRRAVRELMPILWRNGSAHLDFIDPQQLLLRIDLADFDWNADTDWHRIVSQYRYGLSGKGKEPAAKLRQQVEQFTQEQVPVVRADWFVVALTRPPLAGPDGFVRTPFNELPESIRILNRQYSAQTLDLAACARELGLSDDKVLGDLIGRHENLQQEFGLAPLLRGERIRREWWESDRNFFSPYQELARLLDIGKPVRVQ